jgi:Ser/Thr protein kinase RdoA (MazF antagonist)
MGWRCVQNNGNDDPKVLFEHSILAKLKGQQLSFSIPETIPSRSGAAFVKLSSGASACLFKAIRGGLPKLSKMRDIGFCAGELSRAMSKITKADVPRACPTFPYHDIYKVHRAVTRDLFFEQLKSSAFDDWRVFADEVENDLEQVESSIGLYHGSLPWSFIHGDLHYDNILVDEAGVTGLLDFEFSALDWRAMELAICLSKYCSEPDPMVYFEQFVDGFAVHGELSKAEIEAVPILIRLRILSNVVYFVGRALAGEDLLSTLTSRIETYCKRLRWLKTNEAEIVGLIMGKFVANHALWGYETAELE